MPTSALFKTVSNRDSLKFWEGNALNYQKVREFAGIDARDVARLTGLAKSSVRYDAKAPKEVKEHLENIANICNLVFEFFSRRCKNQALASNAQPDARQCESARHDSLWALQQIIALCYTSDGRRDGA
jgi:hypothetical protein